MNTEDMTVAQLFEHIRQQLARLQNLVEEMDR